MKHQTAPYFGRCMHSLNMARGRCYMWFFLQMRRQVQGGKEKTAIVSPPLPLWQLWRCGPPAGEHWARRQYEWLRQVWSVWALLCATGAAFRIAHQTPSGSLLCRCFSLSSERDKNFYAPALAFFARAYLAVKADDLCTVFTLEFMCYCDKAGGVVCVSVWWFMSVYWDRRLSDGLLEDTNNLPWECKVPWVPNPSPYLQRSHMSNACCPLHHLTTALLVTICKLHAFSCVLQGGYNELHLGKTIASDCQKRLKYINKKLLSLC